MNMAALLLRCLGQGRKFTFLAFGNKGMNECHLSALLLLLQYERACTVHTLRYNLLPHPSIHPSARVPPTKLGRRCTVVVEQCRAAAARPLSLQRPLKCCRCCTPPLIPCAGNDRVRLQHHDEDLGGLGWVGVEWSEVERAVRRDRFFIIDSSAW